MKSVVAGFAASTRSALLANTGLIAAAVMFGLAAPATAFAQSAEEAQPALDRGGDDVPGEGNEIVVTATKREQTLQDVPVAVSVTTAATLERAQIRDLKDLATVVPSLRVGQLQSSINTNFFIRGFGNGANNAGIEPSVGVFIDGVYRSRSSAQIGDLPDVRRIEVLRGPQSTLFGKNASAGVISIVTQAPQFKFGGNVEASYGEYNALVVKGVVTGPVSESVAVSLAGGVNKRDGYNRDLGTGHRTNERNRWFLRGQMLFEPSNDLKVRIIGDYDKIDENCCGVVNLLPSSATAAVQLLGGKVNSANDRFGNVVYGNLDSTNDVENYGISGQIDYVMGPLTLTSISAYRRTHAVTNQDSDFTSADLLGRNSLDLRVRTVTQELRLSTNLDGPVNFLAGMFYFNEKINQANQLLFGTQFRPYADMLIRGATGNTQNVVSLENTFGALSGTNFAGKFFGNGQGLSDKYVLNDESFSVFGQLDFEISPGLTFTGGVNYTKDNKRFQTNVTSDEVFSGLDLTALRNAATNAGIAQTVGSLLSVPGGFASAAQIAAFAGAQPAAFAAIQTGAGNATAPLLGLRALQFLPPFLNLPNVVEPGKTGDDNVSWTARLAYDVTSDINLYASYATGFKASSVNLSRDSRPALADAAALTAAKLTVVNQTYGSRFAGPEKSTVYEAGVKANWGLVTANLAVFKQIIRGFQSNIFTGTGFFLANAGKQSTFGIEFEGTAKPAPEWTLSLGMTYLNPKYDSFLLSSVGDLTGARPAGVPPISATFGAEWNHEFGSGDRLILRGDFHYESPAQIIEGLPGFVTKNPLTGAVLNSQTGVDAARPFKREVSEVNASMTYAMHNGVELSVWGRNLTNSRYLIMIFDSPAQAGSISGYPNQPRTWGGSVRYRW